MGTNIDKYLYWDLFVMFICVLCEWFEAVNMEEFIFREECYEIIGCAIKVHNELGYGFLESVYQEALALEFDEGKIPYSKEKSIEIKYKGMLLSRKFVADFLCYDQIIVELKAVNSLSSEHYAQVLNYLKATGKRLGILINFGSERLQYKRIIL